MTRKSPSIKDAGRLFAFGAAVAFLVVVAFASSASPKRVPWQKDEYSYRIPIEISSTESASGQGTIPLVIPRAELPQQIIKGFLKLQTTTLDGKDVAAHLAPQDPSYPLVAWLYPTTLKTGKYYLYMKAVQEPLTQDSFTKPPFLLFDTFEDSWMAGWGKDPLTEDNAPFPWMAGLAVASRILPSDQETGYTLEALAQQTTAGRGGPAIAVDGEELAISWGRLDDRHFAAQIGSDPSSEVTLAASTKTGEHFELRVDVPRLKGEPVRFFLNGKVLLERPLPKNLTGPVQLFLLRRTEEGVAYFRWLGVRPYQPNEPKVKIGSLEGQQAAK